MLGDVEAHNLPFGLCPPARHVRDTIDMALHHVSAEPIAEAQRTFEIHPAADRDIRQGCQGRVWAMTSTKPVCIGRHSQAHTTGGDALAMDVGLPLRVGVTVNLVVSPASTAVTVPICWTNPVNIITPPAAADHHVVPDLLDVVHLPGDRESMAEIPNSPIARVPAPSILGAVTARVVDRNVGLDEGRRHDRYAALQ